MITRMDKSDIEWLRKQPAVVRTGETAEYTFTQTEIMRIKRYLEKLYDSGIHISLVEEICLKYVIYKKDIQKRIEEKCKI